MKPLVAAACGITLSICAARPARADDKTSCISAHAAAQTNRSAGRFEAARAALLTCNGETCPAAVRTDCIGYLAELDRVQPSIVVGVVDPSGTATLDAALAVDGVLRSPTIPPLAVRIDPGVHTIEVTLGKETRAQHVVLHEGEQSVRLMFRFTADDLAPARSSETANPGSKSAGWPSAAKVLFGFGAAAAIAGTITGVIAINHGSSLRDGCGVTRTCDVDDVRAMRREALVADVAFGLGAAALVAGVIVVLWPRSTSTVAAGDRGLQISF